MVYETLGNIGIEVLTLDEAEEEFIDDLDMRPRNFQDRLILLWVESFTLRIHWGWDWPKEILAEHFHHPRIHSLGYDLPVVGHVVQEFMKGKTFDFFRLHITRSVVEIKDDVALINLLHEQLFSAVWRYLVKARQLFQFSLALIGDVESRRMLSSWGANAIGRDGAILGCGR